MHVAFTSVNTNYLNRASILAKSVKKHSPEVHFVLLLVEPKLILSGALQRKILESSPEFDEILTLQDFKMSVRSSLYSLPVVEACTAIKGEAMLHLLSRHDVEVATYLDPDLYFYQSLNLIIKEHEQNDVLLTPHLLSPPISTSHILNDEIYGVAKHGVFNLGFISCKATIKSIEVISWWADRLSDYCKVDYSEGLFTDQKWFDMAPAYFDCIGIVKHQGWNIAPWNFHERDVTKSSPEELFFIHFSKFPSSDFFTKVAISGNAEKLNELIQNYTDDFNRAKIELEPVTQMVGNIEQIQAMNSNSAGVGLNQSTGLIKSLERNPVIRSLVNHGVVNRDFAIRVRNFLRDARKPKKTVEQLSDIPTFDVLILTHFAGGGVETIVQNELVLFSRDGNTRVAILRPNYLDKGYLLESSSGTFKIVQDHDVHAILQKSSNLQVHHILGLESVLPSIAIHPSVTVYLHDRYFLSTQPFRDALVFLPTKPNVRGVDWPLNPKIVEFDAQWQKLTLPLLRAASTIYSPSMFIRNAFLEVDDQLNIEIVNFDERYGYRHFDDWPTLNPIEVVRELKIVLVISPTGPHKGINVVQAVAKKCLEKNYDLRFRIYGSLGSEDLDKVENLPNIEIVGQLPRHRLIYSLLKTGGGMGWIPSVTGESYSLALSDFLIAHIPVLVSSVGALTERAKTNSHIFRYFPGESAEDIADWIGGKSDSSNFLLEE